MQEGTLFIVIFVLNIALQPSNNTIQISFDI